MSEDGMMAGTGYPMAQSEKQAVLSRRPDITLRQNLEDQIVQAEKRLKALRDTQARPHRRHSTGDALVIRLLLTLALMCEARASDMPPFRIGDPMCNTGFTISQRLDTRNSAGTIIKSAWVRKCTNGRIVYGRKV